jgi:hypothetical protein
MVPNSSRWNTVGNLISARASVTPELHIPQGEKSEYGEVADFRKTRGLADFHTGITSTNAVSSTGHGATVSGRCFIFHLIEISYLVH